MTSAYKKLEHPTKYRWVILSIFSCYSALTAFQWIQYSIIPNEIQGLYGIDAQTLDWFTVIYMSIYVTVLAILVQIKFTEKK